MAFHTSSTVGTASSDVFTGTCGSLAMASSLMEDDLFSTPSKFSAHLCRILSFSVISLVPSALSSGKEPALVGP